MEERERQQKIETFMRFKGKYFGQEHLANLRNSLKTASDDKLRDLEMVELKNPSTGLILSILLGGWGIDRFYAGDIGLGVGKLLTGGGCGIWWLVDLFMISKRIRAINFEKIKLFLA